MEIQEAKLKFIESWGKLGSDWGINRTMAQIHALLLIAPSAMCAEHIMSELEISRGNVNMNLRALIDWGLVHKELKKGERKEFFNAEKEMWTVFRCVINQRKKRELDPMIKVLEELTSVKGICTESNEFCKVVHDLKLFSQKADKTLENLSKAEANWLFNTIMKMVR